jgi:hypothetical protein
MDAIVELAGHAALQQHGPQFREKQPLANEITATM